MSKYKSKSKTIISNKKFLFHKVDCSYENKIFKYLKGCDSIIINAANIGGIKHLDEGHLTLFRKSKYFNASLNASIKAFKRYKLKKIILISIA